jgi:glycosyltransferase involved in cell wall biosynthesis
MKPACAIFTNVAPLYSKPLWYELSDSDNINYSFYSSKKGFSGIKTIDISESKLMNPDGKLEWLFLKNIYVRSVIIFQIGIISKCMTTDYDAYILYGEMNSVSNWIAALICRIRRKPLLYWGHGLYGNERGFKKFFRILYYRIANYHLVYSNRSRNYMIDAGFSMEKVYTVYNSLNFNTHMKQFEEKNPDALNKLRIKLFPNHYKLPIVLFIGRLTNEKKISLLIKSINECKIKGNLYNCLIVGDGEAMVELKNMTESLGLEEFIHFYGPCYDEVINSQLIIISDCCVSPGNVGLTAIHSLSLGTPVITHSNLFNQGPEVDAIIQDETGLFFEENSISGLSQVIDDLLQNNKKYLMESNCIEQVKMYWNPANQVRIFDKAVFKSINSRIGE